ncbi:MAG: hypothetical protein AB7U20_10880 [Planctomycetaceae bacterium]
MRDLRRVSILAVLFLVLLRISIGWQFLYEGLWKYNTLDTPQPWSSEGYLRNAQGPMRDFFREMTGDPDDLNWLDYEHVSGRWDQWRNQFIAHYSLDDDQQKKLELLVDGPSQHAQSLEVLPESVTGEKLSGVKTVTYDAGRKRLIAQADVPLLPAEIDELLALVPDVRRGDDGELAGGTEQEREYFEAVEKLAERSQRLSYRQRLKALLLGDPERLGATGVQDEKNPALYRPETGTILSDDSSTVLLKYGEIQRYKDMLADYEAQLPLAKTDYQREHLQKLWSVIQQERGKLVQPVIGLERQLQTDARELLKPQQLAAGSLNWENRPVDQIDTMTIWSLMVLGGLLIVGLLTPLAAVAGAGMLVMFYLPMPPLPGVPQPPGPEHSLIVNKNIIEAVALLAIAFTPTGRWFGIDGLYTRLFRSDYD